MKGPVSMRRADEAAGGMLYLTTGRLIFESHRPDGQDLCIAIALEDIETMQAGWSKLFNLIPIAPNAMAIETAQGDAYRFIMFGRRQWIASIKLAKDRL